jgi:hypothetical protein
MNCYNKDCCWWSKNYPEGRYCMNILLSTPTDKCPEFIGNVEELKRKRFMLKHGLGEEDMINDITYPQEL